MKNKKAATLIELIMTILVMAIIGATIVGTVIFFVQMFVFSPRQLNVQKIGQELIFTMIEGDQTIRGIRYARSVIDASATQFSYTYGYPTSSEQLSVRFRWDETDKHVYRSTSSDGGASWSTETPIPYYIPPDITIAGRGGGPIPDFFSYRKADEGIWSPGGDVKEISRVIIDISVMTGLGSFVALEGSSNFTSSVEIKGFE